MLMQKAGMKKEAFSMKRDYVMVLKSQIIGSVVNRRPGIMGSIYEH